MSFEHIQQLYHLKGVHGNECFVIYEDKVMKFGIQMWFVTLLLKLKLLLSCYGRGWQPFEVEG